LKISFTTQESFLVAVPVFSVAEPLVSVVVEPGVSVAEPLVSVVAEPVVSAVAAPVVLVMV
jgi:hypothetical protein